MSERKKRVLFVINTMSRAGAETALLELFRHLDPKQYAVDLFILTAQGELVRDVPPYVRILNSRVSEKSVLSAAGTFDLFRRTGQAFFRNGAGLRNVRYLMKNAAGLLQNPNRRPENLLWKILSDGAELSFSENEPYDLAVAYLEGGATYFVADHVPAKKKAAFLHVDYTRAGYTRDLDGDAYAAFDVIFAVSGEVKDSFLRVYPEYRDKTDVFHNMLDFRRIQERANEPVFLSKWRQAKVRLLTVGRLTPQKGYDTAIEAMAVLKSKGVKATWFVAGDGKLRKALQKQIARRELSDDFILLGNVENPYPLMKQCDAYVHATKFEGRSIAIAEAMSLGCAVVASDESGNREQITDGISGILCERTPDGIADAILRVLVDRDYAETLRENAAMAGDAADDELGKLTGLV